MSVGLALAAALVLQAFDLEGFLFVIGVAVAVWLGGRGPGLLAVVLSILVLHFVFIAPLDTGSMLPTSAYFVVFSVLAVLITLLSEARHRAERSLLRSRDDLEVAVQERTAELQRTNSELRNTAAERKLAEDGLRRTEATLAHVTRVTTLGEVTASLAHEVKQPLAAIANNANASLGMLASGQYDLDEVRQALADIVSDAERANAIIERVRGLAKRSPPAKAPLQLVDVVADVVALAASESVARHVRIRTAIAFDLPAVTGDRVQLQQVLLNLVVNGMDAMSDVDQASRVLEIRARPDVHDGAPAATVSVQDHGVGWRDDQAARLFEAFYTTKPHGMGMGLAISRSIIDAHGGRLWAEANGSGATFSFTLPAASAVPSRD
jgi:C4-dicarboxylate-specific signal transduction histidine kinase